MAIIETYPEGIYRKNKNGDIILGKAVPILIHNMDYHLTDLKVFEDGKIDCWGGLIDFEEFKKKVESGWVRTKAPKGADISIFPLGGLILGQDFGYIEETELIKEVQDVIRELNNKPTTSDICYECYEKYQKFPTEENKLKLKNAYEEVPIHMRCYILGDMGAKDYPIREIIYGRAD